MRFAEFKIFEARDPGVAGIQKTLVDMGYDIGPTGITGEINPETLKAIRNYDKGIAPVAKGNAGVGINFNAPSGTGIRPDAGGVGIKMPKDGKPVDGKVTSPFGYRTSPVAGASSNHPGVDLASATGTPVRAPIAGKIVQAQMSQDACGGTIAITDGKVKHRFCHCSKISVQVGDTVRKGDVVGLTGGGKQDPGRGVSTGPHLHWEKYVAGRLVDPMANIG